MDRLANPDFTSLLSELYHIYATAPVGLCCVDRNLRYIAINEQLARHHGKPASVHIGRTVREMAPRIAALIEPICERVLSTGQPQLDVEMEVSTDAAPDARRNWVCSYSAVRDEHGRVVGVNAVVQDVTDRRMYVATLEEVNRSLRQRDEFLHIVGDTLPQAMLYRAVNPPTGGFRFAYVGKGVEEVTGLTADHLLQDPSAFVEMIVEDDRPAMRDAMSESVRTLTNLDRMFRVRWPDGSVHWCHLRSAHRAVDGGSVLCEGIMLDTTDLKMAEAALIESQARNQAILSALPDLVFLLSADGTYLDVHPREHRHFFVPPEHFLGRNLADVMPPELVLQFSRCFEQVATEGSSQTEYSLTLDGECRHFEARMVRCGRDRILVVARDVTESKRAQYDADRSRRELARVSRLTMLGEITASLAHELNQPLTAILSNAQAARLILEAGGADRGEIGQILEEIADASTRAGDVIRRVRAWIARDQLVPQDLDVNDVINDVEQLLHSELIMRQVRLTLNLRPGLPAVSADRVQLQQVILNLALNGMEAMHDRPVSDRHLAIGTSLIDRGVQVAVHDRGTGIDRRNMDRLFDPFFSTKPSGLGIGLSICSSIVSAHGGRIWAENNKDLGATLFFTLPPRPAA